MLIQAGVPEIILESDSNCFNESYLKYLSKLENELLSVLIHTKFVMIKRGLDTHSTFAWLPNWDLSRCFASIYFLDTIVVARCE